MTNIIEFFLPARYRHANEYSCVNFIYTKSIASVKNFHFIAYSICFVRNSIHMSSPAGATYVLHFPYEKRDDPSISPAPYRHGFKFGHKKRQVRFNETCPRLPTVIWIFASAIVFNSGPSSRFLSNIRVKHLCPLEGPHIWLVS